MPVSRYLFIFLNVGLGAGAPPIGIPFFWPSAAMPNTVMDEWSDMVFLKWNGATFSATTYPKLAKVIPSLKLTESRGEFIRTWDDGRGVDAGRTLLSGQAFAIQDINATAVDVLFNQGASASGAFTLTNIGPSTPPQTGGAGFAKRLNFNASLVANTATETRPRNIAFNFLVRAK
ncbi:phage tail protein [Escherichia coli]|nr:phage tail protein [Escherichia coli]